ncbi:MAG: DUF1917 domain-containing protein [Thermorudis peleae]|nr:DUF1917 domain-containing protein [Thermorudis peleae]
MTTTTQTDTEWVVAPGITRLDPQCAGFWRSILRPSYAQDVWNKVAADVRAGHLGPAARIRPFAHGRLYELRVYVADVRDQVDVLRIRRVLRFRLGFAKPIACYDWQGRPRDPGSGRDDAGDTVAAAMEWRPAMRRGLGTLQRAVLRFLEHERLAAAGVVETRRQRARATAGRRW